MARVGIYDAKTHLSRLVQRAEAGEEVVIQRNGKPVVRLVPIVEEPRSLASVRGAWRGRMSMAADFDELPEEIAEALTLGDSRGCCWMLERCPWRSASIGRRPSVCGPFGPHAYRRLLGFFLPFILFRRAFFKKFVMFGIDHRFGFRVPVGDASAQR